MAQRGNNWKYTTALCSRALAAIGVFSATLHTSPALANPEGGVVSGGQATINTGIDRLDIHQTSDRAVIDWRSFNIGANEITQFHQPSSSALALNRINDMNPSQIMGQLIANGNVVLINPNGVFFGAGSKVDVAGLVASTANISNADAMAGPLNFNQPGEASAKIINHGTITAKEAGLVGFVAPNVENHGIIEAKLGKVTLASGDIFTLDMAGDDFIKVAVSDNLPAQTVTNTGTIKADGGTVLLTAAAGRDVVNSVITHSGVIEANSYQNKNGKITLFAEGSNAVADNVAANKGKKQGKSTVVVTGTLSATNADGTGGEINVLADQIAVLDNALINVSGKTGGGYITIGGDLHGAGDTPTSLATLIDSNTVIMANADDEGNGGTVAVWSDGYTNFRGRIEALGGRHQGNGGMVETSGLLILNVSGRVSTRSRGQGVAGEWLIDPTNITIGGDDAGGSFDGSNYLPGDSGSVISTGTLEAALNSNGSVIIDTTSVGVEPGDITFAEDFAPDLMGDAALELRASRNIIFNENVDIVVAGYKLDLTLSANNGAGEIRLMGSNTIHLGPSEFEANGKIILYGASNSISARTATVHDVQGLEADSYDLSISGSISIVINGDIGNEESLSSLQLTSDLITIDGMIGASAQTYNGAVLLAGNSEFTGITIDFMDNVYGDADLTVNTTMDGATFHSTVGGGTAVNTLTTSGTVTFNDNVTAGSGGIITNGMVLINESLTIDTGSGGGYFYAGIRDTTDDTHALTIVTGASNTGSVDLNNEAIGGGSKRLASLSITANGGINFSGADVITGGAQTYSSTSGYNIYSNASGDSALTSTSGNITFAANAAYTDWDGNGIIIDSGSGKIVFTSNANVATYNSGNISLTSTNTAADAILIRGVMTSSSQQEYYGNVAIGANGAFNTLNDNSTGADIRFYGELTSNTDNGRSLVANAGEASLIFDQGIGHGGLNFNTVTLTSTNDNGIRISGNVVSNNAMTINGNVKLMANSSIITNNTATIGITGNINGTTAGAQNLTISSNVFGSGGAITIGGTIGATTRLGTLSITSTAGMILGGNVSTNSSQTYTGNVGLNNNATFNSSTGSGAISITGTLNSITSGRTLTLNAGAGTISLGDAVGDSLALTSLSAISTDIITGISLGGNVTTSGMQTYTGLMTLADSVTLTGGGTMNLGRIEGTAAGAQSLTISNPTYSVSFNSTVGANTRLASLSVTNGSSIFFNGNVTTSGAQTYSGTASLLASTTWDSSASNGAISVTGQTLAAINMVSLTANAGSGTISFGNNITGASVNMGNFAATSSTSITLGGNVTTAGTQTYTGPVILTGSRTLTTTNSAVNFTSTVNGTTDDTEALIVTAGSGAITFGGTLGGVTRLASVSATSSHATGISIAGDVNTSGNQTYTGKVVLTDNANFTSNSGTLDFKDDVSGEYDLATSGAAIFEGTIGATTALDSLSVGEVTLYDDVTIGDGAVFSGLVTIAGDLTIDLGGNSHFYAGIRDATDNTHALTITGDGLLEFANEAIGDGSKRLASFSVTAGDMEFSGADVITGGAQTYTSDGTIATYSNPSGDSALTSTSGDITFAGATSYVADGVDITIDSGSGQIIFNNTGGVYTLNDGTLSLTSSHTTGITLGTFVTTAGAQSYHGNVVIAAEGVTVDSLYDDNTGSAIRFYGTVNDSSAGTHALTVNAGVGTITFDDAIGDSARLLSLTTTSTDTAGITFGDNVTTSAGQTYNGNVTISGNDTFTSTTGAIDFNNLINDSVDNTHSLTINSGSGWLRLLGAVGGTAKLTSLAATSTTGIRIDNNITTSGTQTFTSPSTYVNGNSTLTTTNSAVHFTGAVSSASAKDLTISAGSGQITFDGNVGTMGTLAATSTTGISLGGNVTTTGTQTYTGPVTISANTTLATTDSTISFSSTVNDSVADTHSLTLTAGSGAITFSDVVGGSARLASLAATSTHATGITLTGNVTTSGAQTYTGNVALGANTTLNSSASNGNINITGAVSNSSSRTFTANAGTGTVTFGSTVGNSSALSSLTVTGSTITLTGNVSTSSAQSYTGSMILAANTMLRTTAISGSITINGTVDGDVANTRALTLNTTNALSSGGSVTGAIGGNARLASLTQTFAGGTTLTLGGNVTTYGDQSYGTVRLNGNITLDSSQNNGSISFSNSVNGQTVDTYSLTINAGSGAVTFGANLSGNRLASLAVTTTNATGITLRNVATNGNQTYTGNVVVATNSTLNSSYGNGNISITGTVQGDGDNTRSLSINAGTGTIDLGSSVGATNRFTSLSATTTNSTGISLGGNVTTTGAQTYTGNVVLSADSTLATTDSNVSFSGTVNSSNSTARALAITAGTGSITFGGMVGGVNRLASLAATTTHATGITLNSGVTTSGSQTYTGKVVLAADSTLGSHSGNGNISFTSTLDGDTEDTRSLVMDSGTGSITFGGAVGDTARLTSMYISSANTTGITLNGNVSTGGAQTYSGNTVIGANVILDSTADNGDINLIGAVNDSSAGTHSLTITSGSGFINFGSTIGASARLSALTATTTHATGITLGGNVSTGGTQTYNGAVRVNHDTSFTTLGGDLIFNSTLDSAGVTNYEVETHVVGDTQFHGAVGDSRALGGLTVWSTTAALYDDITTLYVLALTAPTTLNANVTLTSTGNETFISYNEIQDSVAGTHSLTVSATGDDSAIFTGTSGTTSRLSSVNITADYIYGNDTYTQGAQTYNGQLFISDATTFDSSAGGGAISLGVIDAEADVMVATSLMLNAGSGAINVGTIGATDILGSFAATTTHATGITLGGNITTSGAQTYTGAVIIAANTILNSSSSNGAIQFTSTINDSSADAHSLTTSAGSGAITFGGIIGGSARLASLGAATSNATGITLGGNVTTSQGQSYDGKLVINANTILNSSAGNGIINIASTIDDSSAGAHSFTVTTGNGYSILGGNVGGATALGSVSISSTPAIYLYGDVTTTGTQSYTGPFTLRGTGVRTFTTTNSNVTVNSNVDRDTSTGFAIAAGTGTVTIGGVLGANADLGSVALTGGTININSSGINTTGAQTYTGAVVIGANTTLDSSSGNGAIGFTSTINDASAGTHSLTILSGGGAINFGGIIGGSARLGSLSATSSHATGITLNGNVTTSGNQTYSGHAIIASNITLDSSENDGIINFANSINDSSAGTHSLTLDSGSGEIFLNQAIGGSARLASLSVTTTNATGMTIFGGATTSGAQTYTGNMRVSDSIFDSSNGNGAINVTGTINGYTANTHTLAFNAGSGTITFGSTIGATARLANFSAATTHSTGISLAGNISSSGNQLYTGNVVLTANTTLDSSTNNGTIGITGTVNGDTAGTRSLALASGSGAITLGGVVGGSARLSAISATSTGGIILRNVTTSGNQTFTGPVTLTANTTLNSSNSNGAISITGAINGTTANTESLTLLAGSGLISLGSTVGATTRLSLLAATTINSAVNAISLGGNITTSGAQTYTGKVTLASNVTMDSSTSNGAVSITGVVNGTAANTQALTINAGSGTITFGNSVGATTALNTIAATTTNSGNGITLAGNMSSNSGQTYTGKVRLSGNVAIANNTGNVAFTSSIDAITDGGQSLTANGSGTTFSVGGAIGANHHLSGLSIGSGFTDARLGDNVFTDGDQLYDTNVILTDDVFISSNELGVVTFNGAIDGATAGTQGLIINTDGGAITLGGTVGGSTRLASLSVDGAGGGISIGNNITTSSAQLYQGDVTLTGNVTMDSSASNGVISVLGGLNGSAANTRSFTVNSGSGTVVIYGAAGGINRLNTVSITSSGGITLSDVTTHNGQTYTGPVTLRTNTTLNSNNNNGAISIIGAVNGTDDDTQRLTVTSGSGAITFGSTIGASTRVASVSATSSNASGITLGGNVTTDREQTYTGAVLIGANATISTNNYAIEFTSTINDTVAGTHSLAVNAGSGLITFGGNIGATARLASISVTSSNLSGIMLGGSVTTSGDQTFTGITTLTADGLFDSSEEDGDITFTSQLNDGSYGTHSLTVDAGAGAINFDTIGDDGQFTTVTATSTNTTGITVGYNYTIGTQTYNGAVRLKNANTSFYNNAGDIIFNGTIDSASGNRDLTIGVDDGAVEFHGAIGADADLGNMDIVADGITLYDNVDSKGYQNYSAPVIIAGDVTLTADDAGNILLEAVDDSVANTHSLTLVASGDEVFLGVLGGTAELASLTVTASDIIISGTNISTGGAQTYNGNVLLGSDATFDSTLDDGDITFNNAIDSADGHSLTILSGAGAITLGTIGATDILSGVSSTSTHANGILLNGNVTTSGAQIYTGKVVIGGSSVTLDSSDDDDSITFNGIIEGALAGENSLLLDAGTGTVSFDDTVGSGNALSALSIIGANIYIDGDITTSDGQNYIGDVVLNSNSVLDSSLNNGSIEFSGTIDGNVDSARHLSVSSGSGLITFGDTVGGIHALYSLGATSSENITLVGNVSTASAQTYSGPVIIADNISLLSDTDGITFTGNINSGDAAYALVVDAGDGGIEFGSTVGNASELASLSATSTESIILNGSVTTSGNQTYTGPVILGSDTILDTRTSNGAIYFSSTINDSTAGAHSLELKGGSGLVTYTGAIGGTTRLASLTTASTHASGIQLGGNVTTRGSQTYTGKVVISSNTMLDTSNNNGSVNFTSTIDDNSAGVHSLLLNMGSGTTTLNGVGTTTRLAALIVNSTASIIGINMNGDVITSGSQAYNSKVTMRKDLSLNSSAGNGNISITGAVDNGYALTLAAGSGDITFGGAVGGTSALTSLSATTTSNTGIRLNGNIRTTGAQTYTGKVVVGTNGTFSTTSNGAITFTSTVDDSAGNTHSLVFTTGSGLITFGGNVGSTNKFTSLAATSTGGIRMNGNVTTSGAQTYTGPAIIGGNATFDSSTGNGAITFTGALQGSADNSYSAIFNAGSGMISLANVGTTAKLTSLAATSTGGITIAGNITTSGAQTYTGPAIIAANATFNSSAGNGAITFTGDLQGSSDDAYALIFNAGSGLISLVNVGTTAKFIGIEATSTGGIVLAGDVTTSGDQTYTGAVMLAANSSLASEEDISFTSTIDGAHALTIDAGGIVSLGDAIGSITRTGAVDITGSTVQLSGDISTSNAGIRIRSPLEIMGHVLISTSDATGANITFDADVDGNDHDLTIVAGAGEASFAAMNDMRDVSISAADMITFSDDVHARNITLASDATPGFTGLTAEEVITFKAYTTGGTVTFGVGSDASGALHFSDDVFGDLSAGTIRFGDAHTGTISIDTDGLVFDTDMIFTTSNSSHITLGDDISTNGSALTFASAVQVPRDTTIEAGAVTFGSTLDSDSSTPSSLTVDAGSETITFTGKIGDTHHIYDLTLSAEGVISFADTVDTHYRIRIASDHAFTAAAAITPAGTLTFAPLTAGNSLGIGSASSGSIILSDALLANLHSAGAYYFGDASTGTVIIDTAHSFDRPVTFTSNNTHDITLAGALASTSALAPTPAVTIASGRHFNQSAGAGISVATGEHWLIYSTSAAQNSIADLTSDFRRYNCTISSCPTLSSGVGNGFIYSAQPNLTVTLSPLLPIKAGEAAPILTNIAYTLSGYETGDSIMDTITGQANGATIYTVGDPAGLYDITGSGTLNSLLGYGFIYSTLTGGLIVDPAPVAISSSQIHAISNPYIPINYINALGMGGSGNSDLPSTQYPPFISSDSPGDLILDQSGLTDENSTSI